MYLKFICCIISEDDKYIYCNLRIPHQYEGYSEDDIYKQNINKILNEDARTIKRLSKNSIPTDIVKIKQCKPFYYNSTNMIIKVKKGKSISNLQKIHKTNIVKIYCLPVAFKFISANNSNELIMGWSLRLQFIDGTSKN